nr:MAG TPA: hypothetical protein [Caudoviricetes sp.]
MKTRKTERSFVVAYLVVYHTVSGRFASLFHKK